MSYYWELLWLWLSYSWEFLQLLWLVLWYQNPYIAPMLRLTLARSLCAFMRSACCFCSDVWDWSLESLAEAVFFLGMFVACFTMITIMNVIWWLSIYPNYMKWYIIKMIYHKKWYIIKKIYIIKANGNNMIFITIMVFVFDHNNR